MDILKLLGFGIIGYVAYEMFFKTSSSSSVVASNNATVNTSAPTPSVQSGNQVATTNPSVNTNTTPNPHPPGISYINTSSVTQQGYQTVLIKNMNSWGADPNGNYNQDVWNWYLSNIKGPDGKPIPTGFTQVGNPDPDLHQGHTVTFGMNKYISLLTSGGVGLSGVKSPLSGYERMFARGFAGGGYIH